MSRRIQLQLRGASGRYENWLAVFSPTGKGELQHDLEVLLSEAARIIEGYPHSGKYDRQWFINGEPQVSSSYEYAASRRARQIFIGSVLKWPERNDHNDGFESYRAPTQVYFDAVEVVSAGTVVAWKQCHARYEFAPPFCCGEVGDLFTGPELLMRLADALINQRGCVK